MNKSNIAENQGKNPEKAWLIDHPKFNHVANRLEKIRIFTNMLRKEADEADEADESFVKLDLLYEMISSTENDLLKSALPTQQH